MLMLLSCKPRASRLYRNCLTAAPHLQAARNWPRSSEKLILKWTNHADLFRINGIGPQFAELLEAAGVDTVKELRHRVAANLAAKVAEVNEEKHLCGRVPAEVEIQKMIDQAKELEPRMTY